MEHQPYDVLVRLDMDGETWELRTDERNDYDEVYAAHLTCTFRYNEDAYAGLWSWEKGDHIESDDGIPWCHFCHVPVPDGVQVIRVLLDK
jgi:hypothetical protein